MARQVASLFGVLRLDDSDYKQKINSASQQTSSLAQNLRNQGQQLQNFGAGMTAMFAPVGVAMGFAITQGMTFDRTFSNINSILQLGTDEAAALRAQILAYGSQTVAGPQATAEAYNEIVSGVADASTHMAILEAATRTAEAGQADLGATTAALISTMNSYGFSAADAARVSDVFTRTVGMGVLSMDELAAAFPQVTGIAAQFNIGIEELGAGMAYLTAQGYSASQSATFMRSMMTTLLNPTADLQAAITALGYESGAALLEAEGMVGAYQLLSQQNGGLDGLITNTEALQGALVLTNDSAAGFFTTYNDGISGATDAAGAIQNQTEQWALLKSQTEGLAIQLSSALMPTLLDLVTNYISPAITAVSDWMTKNPELTTQIALIVGGMVVAGPIIAGVGTVISGLATVIGLASGAAGILTGAMGILASPFVAIGVIIGGLIWMFTRPGGFIGTLQEAYTNAVNLAGQLTTIARLLNQNYGSQVYRTLSGDAGGTNTGVSGAFSGTRAGGGDVMEGRSYLIGENGPETFVPRMSGTVVPNERMGGTTIQVSVGAIHASGDAEGRAAARGFDDELGELMRSRGVAFANG